MNIDIYLPCYKYLMSNYLNEYHKRKHLNTIKAQFLTIRSR